MGIMAPAEIEPHARPERDANDSETSKFLFREGILYFGKMKSVAVSEHSFICRSPSSL
jgi:hypothetical protein